MVVVRDLIDPRDDYLSTCEWIVDRAPSWRGNAVLSRRIVFDFAKAGDMIADSIYATRK